MMRQTKKNSLIESMANTGSGFVVSFCLGLIVFPMFGHSFRFVEIGWITVIFTIASVIRNYIIRRIFNGNAKKIR